MLDVTLSNFSINKKMTPTTVSKRFKLLFVAAISVSCALIIYKGIFHRTVLPQADFAELSAYHSEKLSECRSACTTYDCLYMANEIMRKMNPNVNPCENFYSFACGGLVEYLGQERIHYVLLHQKDVMYIVIRDVIEKSNGPAGSLTEKLKNVYESCINEDTSDGISVQTLLHFLNEIGISKWPNINSDFAFDNPSLEEVLGTLYSYEEAVFFTFETEDTSDDTGRFNLSVSQLDNYQNKVLNAAEMKIVAYEILSHLNMEILNASQIVEDYVEIDSSIQTLIKENKENKKKCSRSDVTGRFVACTEEKTSEEALICNVLKSAVQNTRAESVLKTEGYTVCCDSSFYIENIVPLMRNYSERALANYMALRVLMNNFEYLKFSLRRKLRSFFEVESVSSRSERSFEMSKWTFCVQFLIRYMPYNLGLVFVPEVFPGNSTEEVHEIFKEVKHSIINYIYQQDWIGEEQKKYISNQMHKINSEFNEGMMKLNETDLNVLYQKFEFNPRRNNFFHNVLECKRVAMSALSSRNFNYWLQGLSFEAGADTAGNIGVGVGLLLPFVYVHGLDKVYNYATVGQIFGHEIGHMLFFYLRYKNRYKGTLEYFKGGLSCLEEQYSKFFIEAIGKHVKGNKTVDENFADCMGLRTNEKVLRNYLTNKTEKFYLPGLPYSEEEIFYIAYSQLWCSVYTLEKEQFAYDKDTHSPPMFRALGMLQNSEMFSQIFNCEPNSFMNPEKKCSILDY